MVLYIWIFARLCAPSPLVHYFELKVIGEARYKRRFNCPPVEGTLPVKEDRLCPLWYPGCVASSIDARDRPLKRGDDV